MLMYDTCWQRDHTVLPPTNSFIYKCNEPYLPLIPSHRSSQTFGWYSSFPVPLRVGGWVGLSTWLHTEMVYLQNEMVTHLSTNRSQRRVTVFVLCVYHLPSLRCIYFQWQALQWLWFHVFFSITFFISAMWFNQ